MGGVETSIMGLSLSLIDDVEVYRDTVISFSIQPLSVDLCRNVPSRYQIVFQTHQSEVPPIRCSTLE